MSRIYKAKKMGNVTVAINRFPKTAKNLEVGDHGPVYKTGIRNWVTTFGSEHYYTLVLGCWRLMFVVKKQQGACCGELPSEEAENELYPSIPSP